MDSSSHVKKDNNDPVQDHESLPEGYGDTEAVLLARDPNWLYIYWEITEKTKTGVCVQQGADIFGKCRQVIRVYDVTNLAATNAAGQKYFDITVLIEAKSWYINVPESGRTYCCDVGLLTPEGMFITLVRTNATQLPTGRISVAADEKWMSVAPDFNKILSLSGIEYIGKGSGEVARSLAQRWEALSSVFSKAASWGVNSMQPQAKEGPGQKEFRLAADCELILYGVTEPDALLTVSGRKIIPNPDGAFSMRFALPAGNMDLPVKAISNDGTYSREIEIKVTRATKTYGE